MRDQQVATASGAVEQFIQQLQLLLSVRVTEAKHTWVWARIWAVGRWPDKNIKTKWTKNTLCATHTIFSIFRDGLSNRIWFVPHFLQLFICPMRDSPISQHWYLWMTSPAFGFETAKNLNFVCVCVCYVCMLCVYVMCVCYVCMLCVYVMCVCYVYIRVYSDWLPNFASLNSTFFLRQQRWNPHSVLGGSIMINPYL